jgi:hypothetical protein
MSSAWQMQRLGCQGISKKILHETYPDAEKKIVLLDCLGLTIRLRVWDTHHGESEMVLVWSILDKLFDIPDVRNVMIDPRFCGFVVLGCLYWYVHRVEHEDDTQFVDMTKLLQQ